MNSPILSEKEARDKLRAVGESGLLASWGSLDGVQKENLLQQITQIDAVFLHRQQEEILQPLQQPVSFEPFPSPSSSGNPEDVKRGEEALREGKCACIVLAGGQGSRLRWKGPKGCCPITNVKNKTLFQLLAEKIKAASKQAGHPLQVAVMTSPLNHVETEFYFVRNAFFGLDPRQVTFFFQRMWPFLDFDGHLFLEAPDQIARGPNGNGGVFRRLVEIGLWKKWRDRGIEWVNVLPIDNPLALPYDHEMFGFQERYGSDVVVKVAPRSHPEENAGALVKVDGKPRILEYFELTDAQKKEIARAPANLGLYSFSMPFIERMSRIYLPLHRAKKAVKRWSERGEERMPQEPNAWKFEEFIFDVIPLAEKCEALLYPRETTFAPLKNLKGEDSIETVKEALLNSDRKRYADVTGIEPPEGACFELSPSFYYPTKDLREGWRGRPLPGQDYIEDDR
ncbi:MAG: UTP--glucose-1-phosphate uridylyltransferase [Chlamydiales bacterium]|nr:UTP--glucose-1-phosphate uridylyltransferase [Chlamydiales bacterium]